VTEYLSDKFFAGLDITDFSNNGVKAPISRVSLFVNDDEYYTAGDDTGLEITATCPDATQTMADNLLKQLKGYQYQMYSAKGLDIDPAAELGDGVDVGGIYSVISSIDDDGSGYVDTEAPGETELEETYPTEGTLTQQVKRKLDINTQYYGVSINRTDGFKVQRTDSDGNTYSNGIINSDLMKFVKEDGSDVLVFDFKTQTFKFNGDIVIPEGAISFGNLDSDISKAIDDATSTANSAVNTANSAVNTANSASSTANSASSAASSASSAVYRLATGQYKTGTNTFINEKAIYSPNIISPTIRGDNIYAYGNFGVYDTTGENLTGYMGYAQGMIVEGDESGSGGIYYEVTDGIAISAESDLVTNETTGHYLIVTNKGVRMQSEDTSCYVTEAGFYFNRLNPQMYGTKVPSTLEEGQIFFLLES
jgi:hypothetical protein